MDAARTAKRLGADEALIIYRRTREQMPAHDFEADEAIEEGVKIHWLRTIKQIDGTTFTVEVMKLDEKGFPQPTGEFETLEADSLILALGQDTDTAFLKTCPASSSRRTAPSSSGPDMQTGCPGVFAGRRHGAVRSDGHDGGRTRQEGRAAHRRVAAAGSGRCRAAKHEIASFEMLRLWYHAEAQQARAEHASTSSGGGRPSTKSSPGSTPEAARYEAQRCLSCGNCFECDGCCSACPETGRDQARPRPALRVRLRQVHRLRDLLRPVPVRGDHDDPGARTAVVMDAVSGRRQGHCVSRTGTSARLIAAA